MGFCMAFLMGSMLMAQSKEEGKVIVEITKEVDGEKKTFKGEYDSTEEMYADPAYKEFAGEDDNYRFWFDRDRDEDIFLHLDQSDSKTGIYKYFYGDDDEENHFFFKHLDDEDSVNGRFKFHFGGEDMEEFSEKMAKMGEEMEIIIERLRDDDGDRRVEIIRGKQIRITDVDDEFGKKGNVEKRDELELDDLSFYPNPSREGKVKVRFRVPEEDELSIKVSNLQGKEVFSRYFEQFSGLYNETIDLSKQSEGIYLLEISQGKKRLTRKIVIK